MWLQPSRHPRFSFFLIKSGFLDAGSGKSTVSIGDINGCTCHATSAAREIPFEILPLATMMLQKVTFPIRLHFTVFISNIYPAKEPPSSYLCLAAPLCKRLASSRHLPTCHAWIPENDAILGARSPFCCADANFSWRREVVAWLNAECHWSRRPRISCGLFEQDGLCPGASPELDYRRWSSRRAAKTNCLFTLAPKRRKSV